MLLFFPLMFSLFYCCLCFYVSLRSNLNYAALDSLSEIQKFTSLSSLFPIWNLCFFKSQFQLQNKTISTLLRKPITFFSKRFCLFHFYVYIYWSKKTLVITAFLDPPKLVFSAWLLRTTHTFLSVICNLFVSS